MGNNQLICQIDRVVKSALASTLAESKGRFSMELLLRGMGLERGMS
jgi:hypothetical protein